MLKTYEYTIGKELLLAVHVENLRTYYFKRALVCSRFIFFLLRNIKRSFSIRSTSTLVPFKSKISLRSLLSLAFAESLEGFLLLADSGAEEQRFRSSCSLCKSSQFGRFCSAKSSGGPNR